MRITFLSKFSMWVLFGACFVIAGLSGAASPADDPWSTDELLKPEVLAGALRDSATAPKILCVAFPSLYKQKHIAQALYAGPGNTPEGLDALRKTAEALPKGSDIVIYCGCCPMVRCPNLRPAYRVLKELGFSHIRVLEIPTNLNTDWSAKGYPVE